MIARTGIYAAFSIIILVFFASGVSLAADNCTFTRLARLPITTTLFGADTVPMKIGGRAVSMVIDTGGSVPVLNAATTKLLGLTVHDYNKRIWNIAGGQYFDRFAVAEDVELGNMKSDRMEFAIADSLPFGVDGALPPTILRNYDVELDFANGLFSLYSQNHCPGVFAHWTDGEYARVQFDIDSYGQIFIPVTLDGKDIKALVHTAYVQSVLALQEVQREFDIDEHSPGVQRLPRSPGHIQYYRYPFKSLTFQGITVNNPDIFLVSRRDADTYRAERTLILGLNVLRRLHLYIAYRERVMYLTPATAH